MRMRSLRLLAIGPLVVVASGCASTAQGVSISSSSRGRGTPWTIRCTELRGPDHCQNVQQFADTLRRTDGIRSADVFYRSEEAESRLYYGKYYRRVDPKTGKHETPKQLRADLDLLRGLGDPSGTRYFFGAMPVRMPQENVGNPEWDLSRKNATYSLQVAAFEPAGDFWEFKKGAAEYCEELRKRGYEAYYYHSDASSIVTVGLFGPEGIRTDSQGYAHYSPAVLAMQKDELLKYNRLNGRIYYVVQDGEKIPVASQLVKVPQPDL